MKMNKHGCFFLDIFVAMVLSEQRFGYDICFFSAGVNVAMLWAC
jgi:hypothetical protein